MSEHWRKDWFKVTPKVTPVVGTVGFMLIAVACSQAGSPGVTAGPTVQAAATSVAPTAQALQAQAAPTVEAVATAFAPAIATASTAEPVRVTNVNIATQDTTITVQNAGTQAANLSNWTLHVGSATTQLPSGVDLQPGQTVTLHTTSGTDDANNVYLGQSAQAIASQARPGADVTLENSSGSPVSSFVVPGA